MSADALAAYPDHNENYDIFTDAGDFQLGSCLMQEGWPVVYFKKTHRSSKKLYNNGKGTAFHRSNSERVLCNVTRCKDTHLHRSQKAYF